MFRRKIIKLGAGRRYFGLTIPPTVVRALHAENGEELNLELVSTDDGKTILIVYGDD